MELESKSKGAHVAINYERGCRMASAEHHGVWVGRVAETEKFVKIVVVKLELKLV